MSDEAVVTADRFTVGDGRRMLDPLEIDVWPGTAPKRVTRGTARLIVKWFEAKGSSFHSGVGATLWVTLEHCRVNRVPHTITGEPSVGFNVTKEAPP